MSLPHILVCRFEMNEYAARVFVIGNAHFLLCEMRMSAHSAAGVSHSRLK
jgi:hypothetical protein